MQSYRMALAGCLLVASGLQAQQPTQPPASPAGAAPSRLDTLLGRWEKEMQSIQTLAAQITRTSKDKVFQTDEVFEGKATYMKPNLAVLDLKKKGNAQQFEKYLCTGTYLYQYVPSSKVIHVYELPQPKPGKAAAGDNFLSFFFGMKAEEAKRRYGLTLVKEDQYYVYIEVVPRLPADKADFSKARLVLNQGNFLPRQVWFEQPNGNELTWDLPKVVRDVPVDRTEFAAPTAPPPGWNIVKVPLADAAPRTDVKPPTLVRPSGQ